MRNLVIASLMFLSIVACAGNATYTGGPPKSRDLITYAEIQSERVPGWSTWDLIARLRPHFLTSRSAQSLREPEPVFPVVYLDEIYQGELESLKSMKIERIESIQFLNPYDTTLRFGTYLAGGVIMIKTLKTGPLPSTSGGG